MLVSQSSHSGSFSHVSGVDRIFLAPELNSYQLGPKCDIWSVGAILYLLVTGGVTDKRHEEFFNFKETVWLNVSEELKEFMLMACAVDPRKRSSIDQLLKSDFISAAENDTLDLTPLQETSLSDLGGNMYKFYMAHCINEIVYRFLLNQEKRRTIYSCKEFLTETKKLSLEQAASITAKGSLIELDDFQKVLELKFGDYEAARIASFFSMNNINTFSFQDAMMGVTQLFDEDLDEIVAQSFDKLDITDEANLTVKYIRQGLLVNSRTHVLPSMKQHNKSLLKYVYDMKSTKTFGKTEFSSYVRQCLEQQEERGRSTVSRANYAQMQQALASGSRSREESSGGGAMGKQRVRRADTHSSGDSGKKRRLNTGSNSRD